MQRDTDASGPMARGTKALAIGLVAASLLVGCSKTLPNDGANAQLHSFSGVRGQRYTEMFLIGGNPITKDLKANVYNTIALNGGAYESVAKAKAAGAPTLNYGMFLNTVIDFLIVAFVIFLLVKQINRLKRTEAPPAPKTKECPYCMSAIALKAVRCPQCTSEVVAA